MTRRGWFWALFAVTLAVYAAMLLWTLPLISREAGGLRPFDLRPWGYSGEAAQAFLDALSAAGRATYLGTQAALDLVFPPLMAATAALAFSLILPRRPAWLWAALIALPLVAMGFDWLENWRVRGLLLAEAPPDNAQVAAASRATVLKSAAYSLEYLALLAALAAAAWRKRRGPRTKAFAVAIDGPAAAGKGTISKAVAERYGFAHLDTGLLYRAVGRRVLDGADPVAAAEKLAPEDLDRADLRLPEVSLEASRVASNPEVRAVLVAFQRRFARRAGGAVLDGRDIGTVICPGAEVKLFVTASDETRAQRRYEELRGKGHEVTLDQVLADQRTRDARDRDRDAAPLKPAADAVVIDTTTLDIRAAVQRAVDEIDRVRGVW